MSNSIDILTGTECDAKAASSLRYAQRRFFPDLAKFLSAPFSDREKPMAVLYGLRHTGKTTAMLQAASLLGGDRCAILTFKNASASPVDVFAAMEKLQAAGVAHFFLDEITVLDAFPSCVKMIHDEFNSKVVFTGADSLAFWLEKDEELYENCDVYATTWTPYSEWRRLFAAAEGRDHGIDEYIQRGGVFARLTLDSEEMHTNKNRSSEYIYSAIAENIQNSLALRIDGASLGFLANLWDNDMLTHAIMEVMQQETRHFVARALPSLYADNNIISRHSELSRNLFREELEVIRSYLHSIDVLDDITERTFLDTGSIAGNKTVFVQPGLRYAQLLSLLDDTVLPRLAISECLDALFVDTVQLEMKYALQSENVEVFSLKNRGGKGMFDAIVRDLQQNTVDLYIIKRADVPVESWNTSYQDADFMGRIEREFGKIKRNAILYCGETKSSSMNGVELLSTSAFLEEILPAFQEIKKITPSDHICHMSPCQ